MFGSAPRVNLLSHRGYFAQRFRQMITVEQIIRHLPQSNLPANQLLGLAARFQQLLHGSDHRFSSAESIPAKIILPISRIDWLYDGARFCHTSPKR